MGRYAQSRRRGVTRPVGGLPAPPAPSLYLLGGIWIQSDPGCEEDPGGYLELWSGTFEGGPDTLFTALPWETTVVWGERGEVPAAWLWAREIGGGVIYEGSSPWSDPYDNTGA